MTFKPVRCRDCAEPSVWTVKARVPARATSRLGNKSFQANCCDKCLPSLVSTALTVIDYTAPVKVELWMPAAVLAWANSDSGSTQ